MKNKFIYLAVLAAGFISCEPEFENEVNADYTAGDADFSTYVAVGNSLTAGYMDGTVYRTGQMNSYPNMLSQQFSLVGGGSFTQPSYADDTENVGGLTLGGLPLPGFNTRLVLDATDEAPENIEGTSSIDVSALQTTAYNNMGVPGVKTFHLLTPGYGDIVGLGLGTANPYYVRHATSSTSTVLGDAMSLNPTFFTCFIGGNDVLSYATSGGVGVDQTGNPDVTTYGFNDITDPMAFAGVYDLILNGGTHPLLGSVTGLAEGGAKGVIVTVPGVTSLPYFTTVPYAPLTAQSIGAGLAPEGSDEATQIAYGTAAMTQLNSDLYNNLDAIFTAYGEPDRVNALNPSSANPLLIYDADATDRSAEISGALQMQGYPAAVANEIGAAFGMSRQTTSQDLVVLPASGIIGKENATAAANPVLAGLPAVNNGVSYPMENQWVLTETETDRVATATTAYNNIIVSLADANDNIVVLDANALMNQLVSGLQIETGQIYTADYFSGITTEGQVLFSLDGVHPNARGYAVIANAFINTINGYFNANLPLKYVNDYPGTQIKAVNE